MQLCLEIGYLSKDYINLNILILDFFTLFFAFLDIQYTLIILL